MDGRSAGLRAISKLRLGFFWATSNLVSDCLWAEFPCLVIYCFLIFKLRLGALDSGLAPRAQGFKERGGGLPTP
jgi:hypothetical protein